MDSALGPGWARDLEPELLARDVEHCMKASTVPRAAAVSPS